jgi:hypothetical protein
MPSGSNSSFFAKSNAFCPDLLVIKAESSEVDPVSRTTGIGFLIGNLAAPIS